MIQKEINKIITQNSIQAKKIVELRKSISIIENDKARQIKELKKMNSNLVKSLQKVQGVIMRELAGEYDNVID
jgi:hypothetical protein